MRVWKSDQRWEERKRIRGGKKLRRKWRRRMRDRRERGRATTMGEREGEGGEGEAMKYRMPFLLLLLLLQSCSCFLPAFVRPATCCLLARFFRLFVSLSVSDSRLNRKSNYTPIILPCQILNSAGAGRAPPPPPNRCSYPGEGGARTRRWDGMEEKERGREAREATARA